MNRRTWMGRAVSGPVFLTAALAQDEEDGRSRAHAGNLPAPIAALKSRRQEAKPISREERERRCDQAQALMRQANLNAICLAGGTSLYYFTGVRWGNSERLFAWLLPRQGKGFYVAPAFEEGRVREQIAEAPDGAQGRVWTWQEDEDPYALLHRGLADAGASTGRLGLEEHMPFVFSDGIARACPGLKIVNARDVVSGCRMRKSPAELALMTLANQVTLSVYRAVYESLQPGMTQADASKLIAAAYDRMGFRGEASVQVGEFSALPHGSRKPQVIREGTVILVDDGCTVEGYQSDITRTFVLGKASDKVKHVFDVVLRAQTAALREARPGVPAGAVDAAARKVIAQAGFGEGYAHFAHRLGHGIGLDGHEWPYLVKGNSLPLASGMTFSDEPGIYLPGEFGVRLEDDMHITEGGAQLFTPQSPSPEHPFAESTAS